MATTAGQAGNAVAGRILDRGAVRIAIGVVDLQSGRRRRRWSGTRISGGAASDHLSCLTPGCARVWSSPPSGQMPALLASGILQAAIGRHEYRVCDQTAWAIAQKSPRSEEPCSNCCCLNVQNFRHLVHIHHVEGASALAWWTQCRQTRCRRVCNLTLQKTANFATCGTHKFPPFLTPHRRLFAAVPQGSFTASCLDQSSNIFDCLFDAIL